jgi:hypothetical protein
MAEPPRRQRRRARTLAGIAVGVAALGLIGCGTPGATAEADCRFQPGGERQAESAANRVAEAISEERPDAWVGIVLSHEPTGCPTLYIKGPRDAFIDEVVSAEAVPFVVEDDQPFSFAELEERQLRVQNALIAITPQVGIGFDIARGGVMEAVVTREEGVDRAMLEAAIPADLRDSVELRLVDTPVIEPEG